MFNDYGMARRTVNHVTGDLFLPNSTPFSQLLGTFIKSKSGRDVSRVHARILKTRFSSEVFIRNRLIDAYGKCACLDNARKVFDKMFNKNIFSWNSMIDVFLVSGLLDKADGLFCLMPEKDQCSWMMNMGRIMLLLILKKRLSKIDEGMGNAGRFLINYCNMFSTLHRYEELACKSAVDDEFGKIDAAGLEEMILLRLRGDALGLNKFTLNTLRFWKWEKRVHNSDDTDGRNAGNNAGGNNARNAGNNAGNAGNNDGGNNAGNAGNNDGASSSTSEEKRTFNLPSKSCR